MICENCGNRINEKEKFCTRCGASVDTDTEKNICNNCGTENESKSRFCKACGANLNKDVQIKDVERNRETGFKGFVKDIIQTPKKRIGVQYILLCFFMSLAVILWCTKTYFVEIEYFDEIEKLKFSVLTPLSNEELSDLLNFDGDMSLIINGFYVIVNALLSIAPMILCLVFTLKIILDKKVLKPKALTASKIIYILQLVGFIINFFITKFIIKESIEFKVGMTFGGVMLIITLIFAIVLCYAISYQNYRLSGKDR